MVTIKYQSPIGNIFISADNEFVTQLYFEGGVTTPPSLHETNSGESTTRHLGLDPGSPLLTATKELDAYFAGTLKNFTVPLKLDGTPFRQQVWKALQAIPYGETISYKELARRIDNPAAIRAVGGANHHNPISIFVPCHRVVGASGKLTGYGGGLHVKEYLLKLEKR